MSRISPHRSFFNDRHSSILTMASLVTSLVFIGCGTATDTADSGTSPRDRQTTLSRHDRSQNWLAYDYGWNILQFLEPDAILFTLGDNDTYPLWYLQEVAGVRRDVRVVNLSLLNAPWYIKQLRDEGRTIPLALSDDFIDRRLTGGGYHFILYAPVAAGTRGDYRFGNHLGYAADVLHQGRFVWRSLGRPLPDCAYH
ncbi:hypothetical protein ACFL55_02980 [Candidatus Latescibacterota bacterium]